jgi:hypothetical protein
MEQSHHMPDRYQMPISIFSGGRLRGRLIFVIRQVVRLATIPRQFLGFVDVISPCTFWDFLSQERQQSDQSKRPCCIIIRSAPVPNDYIREVKQILWKFQFWSG